MTDQKGPFANQTKTKEDSKEKDTVNKTEKTNVTSVSEDDVSTVKDDRSNETEQIDTSSWKTFRQYADSQKLSQEDRAMLEHNLREGNHDLNQARSEEEWEYLENEFVDEEEEGQD